MLSSLGSLRHSWRVVSALPSRTFSSKATRPHRDDNDPLQRQKKATKSRFQEPRLHRRPLKECKVGRDESTLTVCSVVENQRVADAIDKAVKLNSWEAAFAAFNTACEPDARVYGMIIKAAAELGHFDKGEQLFKDMKKQGIRADAEVYAAVFEMLGRNGAHKRAHELSQRVERRDTDICKEPSFLTGLLSIDARQGDASCAEAHLQAVVEPNRAHYSLLLDAYCQAFDGEGAIGCLDRMRDDGFSLIADDSTKVLASCRRELLQLDDESRGWDYMPAETKEHHYVAEITSRMAQAGVKPDSRFMEERVAMALRVARLADAPLPFGRSYPHTQRFVHVSNVLKLIEQAKYVDGGLTNALKRLQHDLKKLQKPGLHGPDLQVVVGGSKDGGRRAH